MLLPPVSPRSCIKHATVTGAHRAPSHRRALRAPFEACGGRCVRPKASVRASGIHIYETAGGGGRRAHSWPHTHTYTYSTHHPDIRACTQVRAARPHTPPTSTNHHHHRTCLPVAACSTHGGWTSAGCPAEEPHHIRRSISSRIWVRDAAAAAAGAILIRKEARKEGR